MSSGLHTDVSKKTPGRPREAGRERGEVGDAAVGDDQLGVVALDELGQAVGDRRQAAAAVDQDRDAAVGGELEDRREPLVVQVELLRPRVQLDPARAGVEAARRPPRSAPRSGRAGRTASKRPFERSAKASVRSFAALKDGCRSGSSRQNMNAPEIPYSSCPATSSSKSPTIPSMSVPRWTCASKISASRAAPSVRAPRSSRPAPATAEGRLPSQLRSLCAQTLHLAAQVLEVRLRVDRVRADRPLERLHRHELPPVPVEPLAEHLVERAELARLELGVEVGQLLLDDAPDLDARARSRARRWGSSRSAARVQCTSWSTPRASSGTSTPEELAHPRVPRLGQVGERRARPRRAPAPARSGG